MPSNESIPPLSGPMNDLLHQWMYSFMPVYTEGQVFEYGDPHQEGVGFIFLVGFCKICRNGVTVRLNNDLTSGKAIMTLTDVPKYGCVPVE